MNKYVYIIFFCLWSFLPTCICQTWDWTNYLTEGGNDYVQDVETDKEGNVYIAARARNQVRFTNLIDTFSIFTDFIGDSDMAVAKYNKDGKLLWAKRDGSFDQSEGYGVAVDLEGNVVSTGTFFNEFYFGTDTIRATPKDSAFVQHVFICKYDKDGERLWARAGKILNGRDRVNSIGYEVITNEEGDVIATGLIQGLAVFETDTIGVDGVQSSFIVSYDKDGNLNWAKSREKWGRGYDLALNNSQEIINVGDIGFGQRGLFIQKLSGSGTLIWEKEYFGGGSDQVLSVEMDKRDQVYFAGIFENEVALDNKIINGADDNSIFIGKIDSNGVTTLLRNVLTCDSTLENIFVDMAVFDNNLLLSGTFWGSLYFEKDTIKSVGDADGFVACFDTLGNYKWVKHLKGKPIISGGVKNSDGIRKITLDENNNLLVCGYIKDSIVFDSIVFPGLFGTSGFVAKLFLPIEPTLKIEESSICEGDSVLLQANGYGSPLQYEWFFDSDFAVGSNPTVTFENPGQFDIKLIVSNPYVSDTISFTNFLVNPNPLVDLGMDTTICEDNLLSLDAGTGFIEYFWSTGDTTSTIDVDVSGNYLVEVVDTNGCIGEDEISVLVEPCVGVKDKNFFAQINAVPNPSFGQFYLEIPFQNGTAIFYDITGSQIAKKELNFGKNEIEITTNSSSLILFKIFKEGIEVSSGKLIVLEE